MFELHLTASAVAPTEITRFAGVCTALGCKLFEWHCKVLLHDADAVLSLCERHGAHLSRNAQRGGSLARFITLRQTNADVDSRSLFEARVRLLLADACALSSICTPLKQQFEACLFDSNVAIDADWLEKLS